MKLEELKHKWRKLKEKSDKYLGLFVNPDFAMWKREVVDVRLESYQKSALAQNVDTPEGREAAYRAMVRYQELKFISEDIFELFNETQKKAIKELDK